MTFKNFAAKKAADAAAKPALTPAAQPAATPVAVTPAPSAQELLKQQLEATQAALAAAKVAQAAPVEATVEVVPAAVQADVALFNPNAGPNANLPSVFGGAGAASALSAFIASSNEGSSNAAFKFPVVAVAAGNTGGSFVVPDQVAKKFGQELADSLPTGKKAIEGVYLDYRVECSAWPKGYDDREDKEKPAWSVACGSRNPALVQLITKACKNYQFTKKADKGEFDYDKPAKAGHPRLVVQMLVFLPDIGPVIIQTPMHYVSVERTLKHLARNVDGQGNLRPFPVKITPVTQEDKTATQTWKTHHLEFTVANTETGKKAWDQFNEWRDQMLPTDTEGREAINEFLNGSDRPATTEISTSLQAAANI